MADAEITAAPEEPVPAPAQETRASARKTWLTRLALAVAAIAILWTIYYFVFERNYISTDNAYVNAEVAQVTPLISAQAIEVAVTDTKQVKRGDVLVRLDPTNAEIAIAQAEADLAEARRRFRETVATGQSLSQQVTARGADITQAQARLTSTRAELEKARVDLQRREALSNSGAVSGEELTSARRALTAAQASVAEAQAAVAQANASRGVASGQLAANRALVEGATIETDPAVLAAKAKLRSARLDLQRTVIKAPIDGIVTRRSVQVGQRVAQGTPVMAIVPLTQVYIDANFKERQLERVRVGMSAKVTADIYGSSVVYHGKVAGLSGATGSALSLIPAQNATGNWIKVVQRLPVRIELDPRELEKNPLRVGLSTEVEIDLAAD